jgi:hypothetical protein
VAPGRPEVTRICLASGWANNLVCRCRSARRRLRAVSRRADIPVCRRRPARRGARAVSGRANIPVCRR